MRFSTLTSQLDSFIRHCLAPRCPQATCSRGGGGSLFTPLLPLCTFFLSDALWHVLGRRRSTCAPLQRPGLVSIFIKLQWRRAVRSGSDHPHHQQPTMGVVTQGTRVPSTSSLSFSPHTTSSPPFAPSLSAFSFECFLLSFCPFFFFFPHPKKKSTLRASARPSARPGIGVRLTGSIARRVLLHCTHARVCACVLFEGSRDGCRGRMRERGQENSVALLEFT